MELWSQNLTGVKGLVILPSIVCVCVCSYLAAFFTGMSQARMSCILILLLYFPWNCECCWHALLLPAYEYIPLLYCSMWKAVLSHIFFKYFLYITALCRYLSFYQVLVQRQQKVGTMMSPFWCLLLLLSILPLS